MALACIIAPLWVPLPVTVFAYLVIFPHPQQHFWVAATGVLSVIFSYGGTFLLGLPVFAVLRARQITAFWLAPVLGFSMGAKRWAVFLCLFALSLNERISDAVNVFRQNPVPNLMFFVWPACSGALVGTTFWLIARPDRSATLA
jgi:hypothetical protein